MTTKTKHKIEYGDFQTPLELARQACAVVASNDVRPRSIVEPTCGRGNFLKASVELFPTAQTVFGLEFNSDYVESARDSLRQVSPRCDVTIDEHDFFTFDWRRLLRDLPDPLLVVGNPPWVTNADLSALSSTNLPNKSNFDNHRGIDAITGKGNFDISEWMLIQALGWLDGRDGAVAMLCKTAVARKVLRYAWKRDCRIGQSQMRLIDAAKFSGAAVDACLLVMIVTKNRNTKECNVFRQLDDAKPQTVIGWRDGTVVADADAYDRHAHLYGIDRYKWRSGVKHDCSTVIELVRQNGKYRNKLGEILDLEEDFVFPMLKSSDLAGRRSARPTRWMLVTQRRVGESTHHIRDAVPKTWNYLQRHAALLDARASSIYRGRPRFSIFVVGNYTFSPWKVAISGFYKSLDFSVIGPRAGKPVVLDDTCYFLAFNSEHEARLVASILNSTLARDALSAFIFWDSKRPITVDVLKRVDVVQVAKELGVMNSLVACQRRSSNRDVQLKLF